MKTTILTMMTVALSAMVMTAAAGCTDAREAEVKDAVEGTFAFAGGALELTYAVGDHYNDCPGEGFDLSNCTEEPLAVEITAQVKSACYTGELGGSMHWDSATYETNLVLGALHLRTKPEGQDSMRMVAETSGSIDDLPEAVCLKKLVGEGTSAHRQ